MTPTAPEVCLWCHRAHKGCPKCGAETGCTDDHYNYAEVLAFCGCDAQEADGVKFVTIGDMDGKEEEDDGD